MNYRMISYVMGQILKVVGLFMLLPIIVGFIYGEKHVIASFGIPFLITMAIGFSFTLSKPKNNAVYSMEGFVSVAASWVTMSCIGALPFVISGEIKDYPSALFETVSGFTTTGASILSDVEAMSRSCLFWRAFTHWLGGMGVLMFVLAIMSSNDSRTMHMMRAECAGPKVGRLVSKSRFSARILYGIYITLTVSEAILLMLGGMPLYDAIVHSCSSAGTGGFSMWGNSIGHYNSVYIEMVVATFIILFGVNFNLYYYLLIKKFSLAYKNEEVRTYFGVIIVNIIGAYDYFSAMVCGDMITNGKPDPDIYLTAAKELGLPPQVCVAFEDSPNGITAAHAAGCHAIMIPDMTKPDKELEPKLSAVYESLDMAIEYFERSFTE